MAAAAGARRRSSSGLFLMTLNLFQYSRTRMKAITEALTPARVAALALAICCVSLLAHRREAFHAKLHAQIAGGYSTEGAWPWYVQVIITLKTGSRFICGGVLISRNTVLTAAHCMVDTANIATITCFVGADNGKTKQEVIDAKQYRIHPFYSSHNLTYAGYKIGEPVSTKLNENELKAAFAKDGVDRRVNAHGICDLALVYLPRDVRSDITPITLSSTRNVAGPVIILGRGRTDRKDVKIMFGQSPAELQAMIIDGGVPPIVRNQPKGMIVFPANSRHFDHGDSGGPVIVEVSPKVYRLVGLVCGISVTGTTIALGTPLYINFIKKYATRVTVV